MQITVFPKLELGRRNVICKIHSYLHTLFLEYKTQIGKKKILGNVFQSNCSSHAELLTNLRKIEKRSNI